MIGQKCGGGALILCLSFLSIGGCSIWESYSHPDHGPTRADRICHPYGDCVQGVWVATDRAETGTAEAHAHCVTQVGAEQGNDWKKKSVTQGLEIGECMERRGFLLKQ
ncbi:MAG TPA: hypothetical protein PKM72_07485 [Nitrospirales bacterium]|nr:hypothetical protein [Nitrospirales bacterium]